MQKIPKFQNWKYQQTNLILPVDLSARVLSRQRFLLLDQLRTTLASVLHVSIPRKNLKKQSGAAAADRAPTLKSVTESPNTKREYLNSRNRAQWISV